MAKSRRTRRVFGLISLLDTLIMADAVDESLFFAGSEDEEEMETGNTGISATEIQLPDVDEVPPDSEASSRQASEPLFLPESDEEDADIHEDEHDAMAVDEAPGHSVDDADDIEILDYKPGDASERASSVSSVASIPPLRTSSPASSDYTEPVLERPNKKRRLSTEPPVEPPFESAFLGTFIIGNAWSTVKGRGYIKVCISSAHLAIKT